MIQLLNATWFYTLRQQFIGHWIIFGGHGNSGSYRLSSCSFKTADAALLTSHLLGSKGTCSFLLLCAFYLENQNEKLKSGNEAVSTAQWFHTWGVGLFGQNFLLLFFCFYNVPYICEGWENVKKGYRITQNIEKWHMCTGQKSILQW